jgi:hypothetical protein
MRAGGCQGQRIAEDQRQPGIRPDVSLGAAYPWAPREPRGMISRHDFHMVAGQHKLTTLTR